MKKHLMTAMAGAAILALAGCTKETVLPTASTPCVLKATVEAPVSTRATVASDGTFAWTDGDRIGVQNAAKGGAFVPFVASGASGGTADFTLEGTVDPFSVGTYAIYPASVATGSDATTVTLPANYDWTGETAPAPMLAAVTDGNLPFKHLGGILKCPVIQPAGTQLTSVTFTLSNKVVGSFPITDGKITTSASASDNAVTFQIAASAQSDAAKTFVFDIPVPVGDYKVLGVAATASTDSITAFDNSATTHTNPVARAGLIVMQPLSISGGAIQVHETAASTANTAIGEASGDVISVTVGNATADDGYNIIDEPLVIPASIASAEDKTVTLTFSAVPESTTGTVTVTDNTGAASSESKSTVNIAVPDGAVVSDAVEITLPTSTVTLKSSGESATFDKVTATTGTNTLIIAESVTVKELFLNGGNVQVHGAVGTVYVKDLAGFKRTVNQEAVSRIVYTGTETLTSDTYIYIKRSTPLKVKDLKLKTTAARYLFYIGASVQFEDCELTNASGQSGSSVIYVYGKGITLDITGSKVLNTGRKVASSAILSYDTDGTLDGNTIRISDSDLGADYCLKLWSDDNTVELHNVNAVDGSRSFIELGTYYADKDSCTGNKITILGGTIACTQVNDGYYYASLVFNGSNCHGNTISVEGAAFSVSYVDYPEEGSHYIAGFQNTAALGGSAYDNTVKFKDCTFDQAMFETNDAGHHYFYDISVSGTDPVTNAVYVYEDGDYKSQELYTPLKS